MNRIYATKKVNRKPLIYLHLNTIAKNPCPISRQIKFDIEHQKNKTTKFKPSSVCFLP